MIGKLNAKTEAKAKEESRRMGLGLLLLRNEWHDPIYRDLSRLWSIEMYAVRYTQADEIELVDAGRILRLASASWKRTAGVDTKFPPPIYSKRRAPHFLNQPLPQYSFPDVQYTF